MSLKDPGPQLLKGDQNDWQPVDEYGNIISSAEPRMNEENTPITDELTSFWEWDPTAGRYILIQQK